MNNNSNLIEKSPSLAEVKLKYNSKQSIEECPEITSPDKAEKVLREIWDEDSIQLKEEFVVLLLNNAKRCLGWSKISSGGATSTIVDPATIFQVALLANATSIILAHNHPSGNIKPSKSDKDLTHRIYKSGEMLGIKVEDHIVITINEYFSFRANNILS
ncbi:JAB domain-containing protein [Fodinibius sp. AD559]|uniref:JAB domain-containing protein n=1 Tax=Fodinibius sp. AD559 TaxID=3424179 RepID=UPI004046C703